MDMGGSVSTTEYTFDPPARSASAETGTSDWRRVDLALRSIAKRRAALDADEAGWLREAERLLIWRELGFVSALDYMERVLGYGPRAAQERLRVARALATLPCLNAALGSGVLAFSAVRELTRVATATTERAWCDAATGKTLREIEQLVSDHRPGDLPTDLPDPEVRLHVVRYEVSAATLARLRQARLAIDEEHPTRLDDDQFIAALCESALAPPVAASVDAAGDAGRAKHQVALTICERCRQGWQHGAGVRIAVDAATVARAECDAQWIGHESDAQPSRAYQDIPPAVVRLVWHRDSGRCQTPGCRSARGLELHHIVHRADGGEHTPANLTLRCSACHASHHHGVITIGGIAPDRLTLRRRNPMSVTATPGTVATTGTAGTAGTTGTTGTAGTAGTTVTTITVGTTEDLVPKGTAQSDTAGMDLDARAALTTLGWSPAVARAAVAAARARLGAAPLGELIREALRRCPRPSSS